jgi:exopolyphosphatase/guanosine-5'-triphosphate,3'-diphosphate pyrophosphatase
MHQLTKSAFAVIDIGSNSLRLVIFNELTRHPLKILDDSTMCRLGELDDQFNLKGENLSLSFETIHRFKRICDTLKVKKIYTLATAAIRLAANKATFITQCKERFGISVNVITGEEEAGLAANGVISAFKEPNGIVADLGGSSLELIRMSNGRMCEKISLPIGPLQLDNHQPKGSKQEVLRKHLDAAKPLFATDVDSLYLVGGSTRAIAKVYMEKQGYPIEIIHGYEMTQPQAMNALSWVQSKTPEELALFPPRVSRRKHLLPSAAQVIKTLIESVNPKNIIISGYGLREGFVYSLLTQETKNQDMLSASCNTLINFEQELTPVRQELSQWAAPAIFHHPFSKNRYQRLLDAIVILNNIGWGAFQEYRAEYSFKKILHCPWIMCTHKERIIIALALFYRYDGKKKEQVIRPYLSLITPEEHLFAQISGLIMRFYALLFDNIPATVHLFSYSIYDGELHIQAPPGLTLVARLKGLEKPFARLLNLRLKLDFDEQNET